MRWLAALAVVVGLMTPAAAFGDVQGGTIVVEIGGVGTDDAPGWPWGRIERYLGTGVNFRRYRYAPCDDIDTNVRQLVNYVRALPSNRVVLAGHSLGGVLALRAVDDLSDVLQSVVLVDAPVNGLSPRLVDVGESIGLVPPCLALHQLEDLSWADLSSRAAERALANGVKVLNVTNGYDNMVPLADQQLPQDVNVQFDITSGTGLFNHTAVFGSSAALTAIAEFIQAH